MKKTNRHWYVGLRLLPAFVLVVIAMRLTDGRITLASDGPVIKDFKSKILPILKKHCFDCHAGDEPEAKLALDRVDPDLQNGSDFETWRMVEEEIRFLAMPPQDSMPLLKEDRESVLNWIRAELLKTQQPGRMRHEKLLLPQFGNYVDHLELFDKRRDHVVPAAPRVWRLRPEIYNTIVPRLGERISGLANALNSGDGSEFKDYSAAYFLDEASTQQLLANAKLVAGRLMSPQSKDRTLKQLVAASPPSQEQVLAAIETAFRKALGRRPSKSEQTRILMLYNKSKKIGGHERAAATMLTAVLMKPEFLFRQELGDGDPDKHGRVRLSQREIAYALSYALGDMPLDRFLNAARSKGLSTNEAVAHLVNEQLSAFPANLKLKKNSDNRALSVESNPRVMQFFREYFHYPFANEVFKDQPEGGEHKASALVADLELTIKDIVEQDRHVLRRLLTTRSYYVNVAEGKKNDVGKLVRRDAKTRKYQTAFSLPVDWKWSLKLQPVEFPSDERAGVLTHPAWLAAWSGNFENHPVQRGKWIRTHLLGGTVPDVPIGVDARVPEKEHTTFRDRLSMATADAKCWRCHKKMDPLGLPFERFDHYGRIQRRDAGKPVDTTGSVSRTPFPKLHQRVSGPTEMLDLFANSTRVEQVFVRHVFRFFLGRNETLGDANTLQDAHQAYRSTNGSLKALLVSLLSSDSFLLRKLPSQSSR